MRSSSEMMSAHWRNCIAEMLDWKEKNPRKSGEGDVEYCSRFYKQFIKEKKMKDLINTIKLGFKGKDINRPDKEEALPVMVDNNGGGIRDVYYPNKLYKDNLKYMGKKKLAELMMSGKGIDKIDKRAREYTERLVSKDK